MIDTKASSNMLDGYIFSFEDSGVKIDAWFSAISGLEKIYVDGGLVSEKTTLSSESNNHFAASGNDYSISIQVENMVSGPINCTLFKNGDLFKKKRLVFRKEQTSVAAFIGRMLFFILLGAGFALGKVHLGWPAWSTYIFVFLVFVGLFTYQLKMNAAKGPPIIEEQDL